MIRYACDACFETVEHDGPNLPPFWASVVAHVHWGDGSGEGSYEQECNARLLCKECRGDSQNKLSVHVERILSLGLDQRPRASQGEQ